MGIECCGRQNDDEELQSCKDLNDIIAFIKEKKSIFEAENKDIKRYFENNKFVPSSFSIIDYSDEELKEKSNTNTLIMEQLDKSIKLVLRYFDVISINTIKIELSQIVNYAMERDYLSMKYQINEFYQFTAKAHPIENSRIFGVN